MSLILSIETTSLQICSVALGENGRLISVKNNTEGLRHAAVLTQLIEDLFGQTAQTLDDLDAVAVCDLCGVLLRVEDWDLGVREPLVDLLAPEAQESTELDERDLVTGRPAVERLLGDAQQVTEVVGGE